MGFMSWSSFSNLFWELIIVNKLFSQSLDQFLLYLLHRKRSQQFHFNCESVEPLSVQSSNVDAFYPLPRVPDILFEQQSKKRKYKIGKYLYESQIESNDLENKISCGLYYEPESSDQNVHVIFVHGWRMDSLDTVNNLFLDRFLDEGYHLYFFTLPYHFEREPVASRYSGEWMVSANIDRTLLSVRQAISDLRALIHWLKQHRGGKIVLIGVSLGGFLTNLVGALEKHIDMLISVFYANSLAYSVWNTIPGKYIKKDLVHHKFTYEQLQAHWAMTDPSRFQPIIPLENILLLSGMYDQYVLEEDTHRLWESWGRPRRILYPCGHAGLALNKKQIALDVIQFLQPRLRG